MHKYSLLLLGDSANLIGSILTHQLPFQLYLGVYFVSIDICLLCQYYYYNSYKHHQEDYIIIQPEVQQEQNKLKHENSTLFQHPAEIPINTHSKQVTIDELTPFSSSASPSKWYTLIDNNNIKDNKIQKFMSVFLFTTFYFTNPASTLTTTDIEISEYSVMLSDDTIIWLGRFFAWTCTTLYLMSRVPQLLKNRRRQSVEGLSASLFIFAVCGNFTYASSILTHPGQTIASLTEALPYLIGSAGTLIFDFSIFCQFLYYNNRNKLIQDMV